MKHRITERQVDELLAMDDLNDHGREFARVYKQSLRRSRTARWVARESTVLAIGMSCAYGHAKAADMLHGWPLAGWYAVLVVGLLAFFKGASR